jgi:hypothetical protein
MNANTPPRRNTGTLEREGIKAATSSAIAGSRFGRASAAPHKVRDQQIMQSSIDVPHERRSSVVGTMKGASIVDSGAPNSQFLLRSHWISLGDGWHQVTPVGTGSTTRCGLHSVVQSSFGKHPRHMLDTFFYIRSLTASALLLIRTIIYVPV